MKIQCHVTSIHLAIGKPVMNPMLVLTQDRVGWLEPRQCFGFLFPEFLGIIQRSLVFGLIRHSWTLVNVDDISVLTSYWYSKKIYFSSVNNKQFHEFVYWHLGQFIGV